MLPPLEEHGLANELEPGSELERRILEQPLQLLRLDILRGLDLVGVDVEVNVRLDEQNVVDCDVLLASVAASRGRSAGPGAAWGCELTLVLAPFAVARSLVVDARQKVEVLERDLLLLDAQLMVELSLRRALDALDRLGQRRARLARNAERVGAAGVRPHVRERDLLGCALLEQQLVLVVEEKDGEGPVQKALVDVGH